MFIQRTEQVLIELDISAIEKYVIIIIIIIIYCMKNNDNDLVSSCFEYVSNNANSILRNKIAYFREKYRIQHDFSTNVLS